MSFELPNATGEQRKLVFGPYGIMTYHCDMGHLAVSRLAQFKISCQADGTFTNVSSFLPVVCRKASTDLFLKIIMSNERTPHLFNFRWSVESYTCNSGYETSDYSTEFAQWCTELGSFTREYSDVVATMHTL